MTTDKKFRVESDLLGELQVPQEAYYGVQTQRAINLDKSTMRFRPQLLKPVVK